MFISQSYQHLIYSATQSGGRLSIRVNYILDEFSSLPAIGSDFPSMISAARSRNIRYLICIQSKSQLVKRYKEEAATIISNCTNWVVLFTRELELLREVSELCGQKKDRTPNISVYDLQHLSKEKDEALLLAGKAKPCLVNLLDIDHFGERSYKVIDFYTPERLSRFNIDFAELPAEAKAIIEEERARMAASLTPGFNPFNSGSSAPPSTTTPPKTGAGSTETQLDVDQLVAKINKKNAELEEEKLKKLDASKLGQVINTIKDRRDELYQASTIGSTEE